MFSIKLLQLIHDFSPDRQMNGWKAQDAISVTRNGARALVREKDFRRYAVQASTDIYDDSSKVLSYDLGKIPSGQDSTVLFISPVRSKNDPDYGDSEFIIPATYLLEIFDRVSQERSG